MTSYDFGDVVLVHFPQSGATARKQRPGVIVILDIGDADLVIAPVTSQSAVARGRHPDRQSSGNWFDQALLGASGQSSDAT